MITMKCSSLRKRTDFGSLKPYNYFTWIEMGGKNLSSTVVGDVTWEVILNRTDVAVAVAGHDGMVTLDTADEGSKYILKDNRLTSRFFKRFDSLVGIRQLSIQSFVLFLHSLRF